MGSREESMEQDYIHIGGHCNSDGSGADIYRAIPRTGKFTEPWLGRFLDTYSIPESGLGVCEVIGKGYYAVIWRDHYGPYFTRGEAEVTLKSQRRRNIDVLPDTLDGSRAAVIAIALMIGLCGLGYLVYQVWESFQ